MKTKHKVAVAVLAGFLIGATSAWIIHAQQLESPPAYVIAEVDVTDSALMKKYGEKVPETLAAFNLTLSEGGRDLTYTYDTQAERTCITRLLAALSAADIRFRDLETTQSSLEDIFVDLVKQ